jgi:glycosyltransferase involved in cell wall biosynthesis
MTSPADAGRCIHHFGPDPAYVGGMGSVIRVLTDHSVGGETVVAHSTWRPNSRSRNAHLAVAAAARIATLPRSDIIHVHLAENGAFVREGSLVGWARLLGHATAITIHGSGFLPFAHRHRRLAATVLRRAHLITCLDDEVLAVVRRLAPRAHAAVVPNPIAVEDDLRSVVEDTDEVVLFAGLIGLRKGADVLSRAWELVAGSRPDARCIVVGPPGDFTVPEIERLEVRAPATAEEIRGLIMSARVVALPSRAEGMPMILTEAMSAGRPFVSTPVGGIPELARHGGVLVDVGDHLALAQRLDELLVDPALAACIGAEGRRFCMRTRSTAVLDARLGELYADALRRSMRVSPSR